MTTARLFLQPKHRSYTQRCLSPYDLGFSRVRCAQINRSSNSNALVLSPMRIADNALQYVLSGYIFNRHLLTSCSQKQIATMPLKITKLTFGSPAYAWYAGAQRSTGACRAIPRIAKCIRVLVTNHTPGHLEFELHTLYFEVLYFIKYNTSITGTAV